MFNKKNKKFLNVTTAIDFSAYTYSNSEEPLIREKELLHNYGKDGYELVSVVVIPNKFREDEKIPYHYDKEYFFKKEVTED